MKENVATCELSGPYVFMPLLRNVSWVAGSEPPTGGAIEIRAVLIRDRGGCQGELLLVNSSWLAA